MKYLSGVIHGFANEVCIKHAVYFAAMFQILNIIAEPSVRSLCPLSFLLLKNLYLPYD